MNKRSALKGLLLLLLIYNATFTYFYFQRSPLSFLLFPALFLLFFKVKFTAEEPRRGLANQPVFNLALLYIRTLTAAILAILHLNYYLIGTMTVKNSSMEPTILADQKVIIEKISGGLLLPWAETMAPAIPRLYKVSHPYSPGDIVVFYPPDETDIFIKRVEKTVGNNYWLTGDNPDHSYDSRQFGPVSPEHIIGKVIAIY